MNLFFGFGLPKRKRQHLFWVRFVKTQSRHLFWVHLATDALLSACAQVKIRGGPDSNTMETDCARYWE